MSTVYFYISDSNVAEFDPGGGDSIVLRGYSTPVSDPAAVARIAASASAQGVHLLQSPVQIGPILPDVQPPAADALAALYSLLAGGGGGGGSTPDATVSVKGKVQLAGDLGGTAAAPTVPGLAAKAPIASPTFTGTPAAPTPAATDSTTKLATTAHVDTQIKRGWPSYAPAGLTRQHNPDWCAYGLSNARMAPQRIAMAKAVTGQAQFNWLNVGDSTALYFGSDVAKPNDPSASYPYVARDSLRAAGVPLGGTGFVTPCHNYNAAQAGDDADPRWTLSAGWGIHNYGYYAQATVAGETATLTADVDGCTDYSFVVDDQFAGCTYVVKNSAGSTIASGTVVPAATNTIRLIHGGGLTDVRSLTLTSPVGTNGTSNKCRIMPAAIYKSTGLLVHHLSFVSLIGTGSSGFENTTAAYNGADKIALLCVPSPDLLTVLLGGNDRFNAYTDSVITTGLTNIFGKWTGTNITKIFIGHGQSGSWSDATMAAYTGSYWAMCEAGGFGFIDMHAFSGGFTVMNAMGIVQDTAGGQTHPNQSYAQMLGRLLSQILRATPSTEAIQDLLNETLVQGANVTLTYNDATGKLTIASSGGGGGGGGGWPGAIWAASTAYTAGDIVELPTGGLAYRTASGTSAATFTAAERDAWTFLPGGHFERLTTTGAGTWKCPVGIINARFRLKAGGGGGGGGASAATGIAQAGGAGGGAGDVLEFESAVVAGTSYTTAVAAGGTAGTGGVAGGNLGTAGGVGGDSTISIAGTTYTAKGGGGGNRSTVGNNTAAVGGAYGFNGQIGSSGSFYPGAGSNSGAGAAAAMPLAGHIGGAGAASSSTTNGGNGGTARTAPGAAVAAASGTTGTAAGGAGTAATEYSCGGGGGGGGTNNTGAGGGGGAGGQGVIEVWY